MVCYANLGVVQASLSHLLKYYKNEPILLVDNHSPDNNTRDYIHSLAKENDNINIVSTERNIGCHHGFSFGFNYLLEQYTPDLLIKCDDDMLVPEQDGWEKEVVSLCKIFPDLAFLGTNFFQDNRLQDKTIYNLEHGEYNTRFIYWGDIPNLPIGIIRTDFYKKLGGLFSQYRTGTTVITEDDNKHLYGGEEAFMYTKANENLLKYGYLVDIKSNTVSNDLLEPDYLLWKYIYGYLGLYKEDYAIFKKDKLALAKGYLYWAQNSDNGLHQEWARNFYINPDNQQFCLEILRREDR